MFRKTQEFANGKPNPILFDDLKMVYVGFVVENAPKNNKNDRHG